MSTMLNMAFSLLARGKQLQALGRVTDARRLLSRITQLPDVADDVAAEAQVGLARLASDRRCPRRARRHLTAAICHQPENAAIHYLLGSNLAADPRADQDRALEHFRKSLSLDPHQPRCLGECGLLMIRQGTGDEGLALLRQAVECGPDDPEILKYLVDGLRLLGRSEDALRELRLALFRNSRDARFRKLYHDFQFKRLRRSQTMDRTRKAAPVEEPILLPFARENPLPQTFEHDGKEYRRDAASFKLSSHHLGSPRLRMRRRSS